MFSKIQVSCQFIWSLLLEGFSNQRVLGEGLVLQGSSAVKKKVAELPESEEQSQLSLRSNLSVDRLN